MRTSQWLELLALAALVLAYPIALVSYVVDLGYAGLGFYIVAALALFGLFVAIKALFLVERTRTALDEQGLRVDPLPPVPTPVTPTGVTVRRPGGTGPAGGGTPAP